MPKIVTNHGDVKPLINKSDVLDFFEKRAEKASILGPTCAVIYQDKNPSLALQRDLAEKTLLWPMLELSDEDHVLDAGCGTGRWAESIIPKCAKYHGVDISQGLVQIAKQRYGHFQNVQFSVCPLEEISLASIRATSVFSRVLSFGVYIYLNDHEVLEALRRIASVAASNCRILVREPIALGQRLTLREHFSNDMDQHYNAIYRTEAELKTMLDMTLGCVGFKLINSGDVYADSRLNNRIETKQRWFLWIR